MPARMNLAASATNQLSEAMAMRARTARVRTPVVYEQNDCVVIEMPAPGVQCDELELRLKGGVALVVREPSGTCCATVILPAAISLSDSVIYCVGGVLSMTFVKADTAEASDGANLDYELTGLELMAS